MISDVPLLNSISNEEKLVFEAIRWLVNKGRFKSLFPIHLFTDLNWPQIISICSRSRIMGFISYCAQDQGWLSHLPEDVRRVFKDRLQECWLRNTEKVGQFKEISKVLTEEKISIFPLKGIVLSHLIYDDMPYRVMGDIDIFIPLKYYDVAILVLENNHISVPPTCTLKNRWQTEISHDVLVSVGASKKKPRKKTEFKENGIVLDIAFERYFFIANEWVNFPEEFFRELCCIQISSLGKNVYILPPSRQLLYLLMNAVEQTHPRLEQILDIAIFMHKNPEAQALLDQETAHFSPAVRKELSVFCNGIYELFNSARDFIELPDNSQKIWRNFLWQNNKNIWKISVYSRISSRKEKVKFLLGFLLPNPDYYNKSNRLAMYICHWRKLGIKIWQSLKRKSVKNI